MRVKPMGVAGGQEQAAGAVGLREFFRGSGGSFRGSGSGCGSGGAGGIALAGAADPRWRCGWAIAFEQDGRDIQFLFDRLDRSGPRSSGDWLGLRLFHAFRFHSPRKSNPSPQFPNEENRLWRDFGARKRGMQRQSGNGVWVLTPKDPPPYVGGYVVCLQFRADGVYY